MNRKEKTMKLTNRASLLTDSMKKAEQAFFAIESDNGLLLGRTGAAIMVNRPGENGIFYWDDKNLN